MKKVINSYTQAFAHRLSGRANAWAAIRGGQEYPRLLGTVKFFQTQAGVLVLAEIHNLPYEQGPCENSVFGFHMQVHTDSVNVRTKITGVAPDCPRGKSEEHFQQSAPDSPLHAPWPLQVL